MFTLLCLVVCVLLGFISANNYTIITPTSLYITAYSGYPFAIQVNSTDSDPPDYSVIVYCDAGSVGPYTFPLNVTSNFTDTSTLRGKCYLTFDVLPSQDGFIEIVANITIEASSTIVAAGSFINFTATTLYSGQNETEVSSEIQCTTGEMFVGFFQVNSGDQTIALPAGVYGNCTMVPSGITYNLFYYFDPFEFQIYPVQTSRFSLKSYFPVNEKLRVSSSRLPRRRRSRITSTSLKRRIRSSNWLNF